MNTIIIKPERLSAAIASNALRFTNLRETSPNKEWDNPATPGPDTALVKELKSGMRAVPWEEGWAYCIAFAEAVLVKSLEDCGASSVQIHKIASLLNAGVVASHDTLKRKKLITTIRDLARAPLVDPTGTIWFARWGSTSKGHAGIILDILDGKMINVEANTSKDATSGDKDREGDWITKKTRPLNGSGKLVTLGFLHPVTVCNYIND